MVALAIKFGYDTVYRLQYYVQSPALMITIVALEKLSADALKTLKIGVSDTLILFKRANKFLYM